MRISGHETARLLTSAVWVASCLAGGTLVPAKPPSYDHVVVVIEENHSFDQIIGSNQAPFVNRLANEGVLFTSMYGLTHPSQPNYLHLFSGANQGVSGDGLPAGTPFQTPNLGSALLNSGGTFAGYSEGLPAVGSTVESSGAYRRRHNPWVNWQDDSPGRSPYALPASVNVPFSEFPAPVDYASLPTVSFVIPDLNHDMHDGSVAKADAWLQENLETYSQWAKTNNSLLVVAWDEDNFREDNRIPFVLAGANLQPGQVDTTYTLHNLLRTIEDMYELPHSGAAAKVNPIHGAFVGESPLPTITRVFQEGVDGYIGTQDTELRQFEPATSFGSDAKITVDGDNLDRPGNQPSQGLIRFDQVVGTGANQIPPGASIYSAQLVLTTGSDSGQDPSSSRMDLHRMLVPWDEASTWNSFPDGGVTTTGTEAAGEVDFSVEPNATSAPAFFAVTQTVQSWVNGQPNFGWVIHSEGTNGWGWNSSEAADLAVRPRLEVVYFSPPELMAGDANQDLSFDQLDLVRVLQAGKYLTGEPATWGEGDWNGAPGGYAGNPPSGDGLFDQRDIVAALASGLYLTGAYAAVGPGQLPDDAHSSNDGVVFQATAGGFWTAGDGVTGEPELPEITTSTNPTTSRLLSAGGTVHDVDLIHVPVPEPKTFFLAVIGAIALAAKGASMRGGQRLQQVIGR